MIKNLLFWGTTILTVVVINFLIIKKEDTIKNGRKMLLRLEPRDPRSLMQGDYMTLRYGIANALSNMQLADKGCIVVSLDEHNVAKFLKIHKNEVLQTNEFLLFYRNRGGLRLGAESFMFQEGNENLYSKAKYGELRVDASGTSVLVGLCGEDFMLISNSQN